MGCRVQGVFGDGNVRALAISSRGPSQTKRFVVNAAGPPQQLGLIATRTPRGFAVSCGSRYGKAAQRSGMQDEVRSQQTNNGQTAQHRAGGQWLPVSCPALARFRLDGASSPTPNAHRPCPCGNHAVSPSAMRLWLCVRPQGRRRTHQAGRCKKGDDGQWHNGPSPPAHGRRSGADYGRLWQVGVSGHGGGGTSSPAW